MRAERVPFHRRLGVRLGLAVTLVMVATLGVTGWVLLSEQRESLRRELTLRVLAETRSLALAAAAPLLRHDPELGLHPLILRALDENSELLDLVVLDAEGVIQGHRDLLRVGETLALPPGGAPLDVPLRTDESAFLVGESILVSQRITHVDQGIGTLVATIGPEPIDAAVEGAERNLLVIGGAGLAFVLFSVLGLVAMQLRPLAPLRSAMARIGAGDLSTRVPTRTRDELGLLSALVNSMVEGLEEAQDTRIQKERLDRELEIARDLQAHLLPAHVAAPAGYEVAANYTPALEVSGDSYDLIDLDDHRIAIVVADVSGKGVPGLVVMAMLRVILRGLAGSGRTPSEILEAASRMLAGSMRRGMFVTCIYGVLDRERHQFTYASAGHCPPLLVGPDRVESLPAGGKALGMFPPPIFAASLRPREVTLDPGQSLLLYTDGLVEAMDPHGRQLGLEPVLALAARARGADDLVERLRAAVDRHRSGGTASDDLTLLALTRLAATVPTPMATTVAAPSPCEVSA